MLDEIDYDTRAEVTLCHELGCDSRDKIKAAVVLETNESWLRPAALLTGSFNYYADERATVEKYAWAQTSAGLGPQHLYRLEAEEISGDELMLALSLGATAGWEWECDCLNRFFLGLTPVSITGVKLRALTQVGGTVGARVTAEAIDFVHGTMAVLVTKNGVPQLVDLEPMSAELLQAWYERCGAPPAASPIIRDLEMRPDREAETLRADLELAGVKRAMLFGGAGAVKAMRFHDLRATFVTWALRQGRGKFWIQDRTGHLTEAMLTRYARQARTLADLRLEPFPAIGKAIPELGELPANVRRMRRRFWGSGTGY